MQIETIFTVLILIISVVIHEVSHGYAAEFQGDPTARLAGRLTINPLPHLDLLGSIIVPGLLILSGVPFVIGWAKPVPYNPYNLRNQKWGDAIVAIAGPLSNIVIAIIFGLLVRFADVLTLPDSFVQISFVVVIINLVLAVFNLVPIPPLDGSKILFSLIGDRYYNIRANIERYQFLLLIIFILFLWEFIFPIVSLLFSLITGVGF